MTCTRSLSIEGAPRRPGRPPPRCAAHERGVARAQRNGTPQTRAEGHIRRSAQSAHAGRCAWHVRRPWRSMFTWNSSSAPRGVSASSASCCSSERAPGRSRASRVATRPTCVSTGTSRSPYANSRTHAAVLRPTPGNATRKACDSATGASRIHDRSSGSPIAERISWIRTDLTFEIPPGRIASSISSTGASRTASHASNRSRSRRNATSRLRSFVDCDSTVSTSSPSASPCGAITGTPYISRSRARSARTRRADGASKAVTGADGIVARRVPVVTEHTATMGDQPVFWRAASDEGTEGRAPVLYLHGVPSASDQWLRFLPRTGGLAPDLPGFGCSGKRGDGDFTIEGYARFVGEFLDLVEVDRIRLVVHDWGAVGLVWAQRNPERVERLVILDSVPLLEGYRWHRVARAWRTRGLGESLMGATTRFAMRKVMPRPLADAVWPHFDQGTQRAILRLYRTSPEDRLAAAGEDLHRLRCPALVLWGERDPFIPPRFADAYAAALGGGARAERVQDAGHWPGYDRPDVVDRVAAFLAG